MKMTMTEAEKYQALRQLVKLTDVTGQGKMSALRHGMEEVLTPRQKQLVHMYYMEQKPMQLIAEELGLPFTLTELMGFEAKLKAQRQEEIASHDDDPDFEIPEYSYWLLDRGWSNEESKFCGDK